MIPALGPHFIGIGQPFGLFGAKGAYSYELNCFDKMALFPLRPWAGLAQAESTKREGEKGERREEKREGGGWFQEANGRVF